MTVNDLEKLWKKGDTGVVITLNEFNDILCEPDNFLDVTTDRDMLKIKRLFAVYKDTLKIYVGSTKGE